MLEKKSYANGQKTYEINGNSLTFYYKSGTIKAEGPYENNLMEGEWLFYRESGKLWQVGNFKKNMKHGQWIRYDKKDKIEYMAEFVNNKIQKKPMK